MDIEKPIIIGMMRIGDHAIYVNDKGRHISMPKNLECVIARRLIKENNLITDIKRRKKK